MVEAAMLCPAWMNLYQPVENSHTWKSNADFIALMRASRQKEENPIALLSLSFFLVELL